MFRGCQADLRDSRRLRLVFRVIASVATHGMHITNVYYMYVMSERTVVLVSNITSKSMHAGGHVDLA